MSPASDPAGLVSTASRGVSRRQIGALTVFFMVLVAGLFYVKWHPYLLRSFTAASRHSIGPSILAGGAGAGLTPSWQTAWRYAVAYGEAIWQAMLLGLVIGSGVQAILPQRWIDHLFGRVGVRGVTAGGLAAVPSMMCTCCTAPVVVGLRDAKSSLGSVVAFWLANPLLNPATVVFIGFVLGWRWAALRLVFAIPMVFGIAYLVERAVRGTPAESTPDSAASGLARMVEPANDFFLRWGRALWRLAVRLIPEYVVIVLLLGAAQTWFFPAIPPAGGNGFLWITFFAIAGTAFVIPTAGEVPIVQSLMALGLGAGPAAALLITLPAVSIPAAVMVSRALPKRVIWLVAGGVALGGIACGLVARVAGF